MTHRRGRSKGRARVLRGRMVGVLCWVLAFSLLSLGIPGLGAASASAARDGMTVVEPCTSDGPTRAVLDPSGQPVDQAPYGRHATHEYPGCPTTWGKHPCCPALGLSLSQPATRLSPLRQPRGAPDMALAPAARAPLPPRGPPPLS